MDGTTTTTSDGSEGERWASDVPTAEQPQLLATAVGDQCANCGARLAGDQRYCVECGERRGKARYSLSGGAPSATRKTALAREQRPSLSSSGALIGGVATLLLAMAVGLLIGLNVNSSAPAPKQQVQVVPYSGAAAAPATSTPAASTPNSAATAAAKPSKPTAKPKGNAAKISAAAKLPAAARKIPKKLQSSVVKVGGSCTAGTRGCTNGKFTGTFFGGG
jgi:hypothetical protein